MHMHTQVITFAELRGATFPSGRIPLHSPAIFAGSATFGDADSRTFFKAGVSEPAAHALWDDDSKTLKLWLAKPLPPDKEIGLWLEVENSAKAQPAPNITVATSGVTVVFSPSEAACWPPSYGPSNPAPAHARPTPAWFCSMKVDENRDETGRSLGAPLSIAAPGFRSARIGQTSPYPGALNTLTVTLQLGVALVAPGGLALPDAGVFADGQPVGVSLVFTGLLGASAPDFKRWLNVSSSTYGQDAECGGAGGGSGDGPGPCTSVLGRQQEEHGYFRNVSKWNNASKTLEVFVARETPREAPLVFSFQVVNSISGQPSPNISVHTTGTYECIHGRVIHACM